MISLGEIDAYLWGCVPEKVDTLVEKCASPAWDIRNATSSIYTKNDVGYYWNPHLQKAGVYFRPHYDIEEGGWCKAALDRAVGSEHVRTEPLSLGDVSDGSWVKVAYSPTLRRAFIKHGNRRDGALRRAGEYLNFFPWGGKETGPTWLGVKPTPLSGMLTSGLVGAGLGYGAGWLGEKMLPDSWKKGRLRKALAVIGGMVGAAPGLGLMGANLMAGDPANSDTFLSGDNFEGGRTDNLSYKRSADEFTKKAFGVSSHAGDVPPVNINRLGQTLWEVGASPQTAAATMSSVYAAQQLPGGVGPGYVTPHQTGLLGTMMGAAGGGLQGYAVGWGVGKGLGALIGMPPDIQNTLKRTGAVLGVINTLVPRLFR